VRYRLSPGKRFYPDYFGSQRGFSGYPELVKSYLSDGLHRDKAICLFGPAARLVDALKKRGVPQTYCKRRGIFCLPSRIKGMDWRLAVA